MSGGWIGRIRRQGVALTGAVVAWGVCVAVSGLAHQLWLVVVLLAFAGGADLVSAVYRQTILQTYAPDQMRGRMQGVFIAVVAGGPRLGDVRAGATAAFTGATFSWVAGGVACAVLAAIAGFAVRPFWRYDGHAAMADAGRAGGRADRGVTGVVEADGSPTQRRHVAEALRAMRGSRGVDRGAVRADAGEFAATVVEVGAGLRRFTFRGVDVTVPYGEDVLPPKACGDVLVPWPNRLRDGQYTFAGAVLSAGADRAGQAQRDPRPRPLGALDAARDRARLGHARRRPGAADRLAVRGAGRGHLRAARRGRAGRHACSRCNTGRGPAPFGAGFHPYLSTHGHRIDEVTVQVPARERLLLDDAQVPVGVRSVERQPARPAARPAAARRCASTTAFTDLITVDGRGGAEVRTKSGGAQLWFDEAFGYLQVFTVDDLVDGRCRLWRSSR